MRLVIRWTRLFCDGFLERSLSMIEKGCLDSDKSVWNRFNNAMR
ncbi:hypothetical protein DFO62_107205 [Serratia fonticola]|nr:hypothetical protein DFO62_107205 [Serratia fonticola]